MVLDQLINQVSNDPLLAIAPIVAMVATLFLAYAPNNIGKDTTLWRAVRNLLPYVDGQARELGFYSSYPISDKEIVGYWDKDVNELYGALRSEGFILSPLAAHKSFEGREEVTSMAHFGKDLNEISNAKQVAWKLTHRYQTHVTVFESKPEEDHNYIITAHHEKSAYSPLTAYQHLKGKGMDIQKGKAIVDDMLERYEGYEKKTATLRDKDT